MNRKISVKKISKYKRKDEAAEISLQDILRKPILTPRDKRVLLSIYYHRCLTANQIAEMHFRFGKSGENTQAPLIARRRLRKMFDYKLIDRFFVDMPEGEGSSPQHVVLDQLGARVVAGLLNVNVEDLDWRYDMNEVRLPYLSHMVAVNDFYLYLLRVARKHGHNFETYLVENHVRHEFKYDNGLVKFNPDAYGRYFVTPSEGFHFFLEWDNGTMTLQTFKKKLYRYHAFYETGEFEKYYGESFPMVLVVAPSEERAISLRNAIYTEGTPLRWLFTTAELAEANPLGVIWLGEEQTPVSLI